MLKNKDRCIYRSLVVIVTVFMFILSIFAQSGGPYAINQSVISNGGVTNSVGGQFALDGTIGQAVAGQTASNPTTTAHAGFWNPLAAVSVSGQVTTPDGHGLRNATVSITDSQGVRRTVTTSSFGFYRFDDVATGDVYMIRIASRLYRFAPLTLQVTDTLINLDFVGLE